MSELPLFPLSGVLLPFGRIPLQIFEQRYLDLVRDCLKSNSPFGVVWIRRGAEVAQRGRAAPELGDYGTCAAIVDWDQLPNGLLGITIEGDQRFELLETHPHVQRMKLRVDYNDAWQVGYALAQLLPLEESLKYELLGLDSADALLEELHALLNQISGAE